MRELPVFFFAWELVCFVAGASAHYLLAHHRDGPLRLHLEYACGNPWHY